MPARRPIALLALLFLIIAACSPGPGAGGRLAGTDWVLQSYRDGDALVVVEDDQYADASFDQRRVSGFSGCNQYDAGYRAASRTLLVSPAAVTLMACDEAVMAFESIWLAQLQASRFYTAGRQTLTIYDAAGETVLVFDAAPRNPLIGPWIVDSFATGPGSVSAPIDGTELTAEFGLATVSGSAGCNSFTGTYDTNGRVVRIGALATTRMACEQDVMDQEAAFLEALGGAARITRRADALLLTDRDGGIQVALRRPPTEVEPEPTEAPTATPEPTEAPTASPTSEPSPSPTAAPSPSPAPTLSPPPSIPPTATCEVVVDDAALATLTYPEDWSTIQSPPELVCRAFDRESITVPEDPATLAATILVTIQTVSLDEAVAAATDTASWDVSRQGDITIDDRPAVVVDAVATAEVTGAAVGAERLSYLVDLGERGTMIISTTGDPDGGTREEDRTVATLMAATVRFEAP